jgi:hypothetical protein
MKAQRFVIVGAFIIAAIISPTPDIMNQVLLALPVIAIYQVGVGLVWLQNRSRAKRAKREAATALPTFEFKDLPLNEEVAPKPSRAVAAVISTQPIMQQSGIVAPKPKLHALSKVHVAKLAPRRVSMDGFAKPMQPKTMPQPQMQAVAVQAPKPQTTFKFVRYNPLRRVRFECQHAVSTGLRCTVMHKWQVPLDIIALMVNHGR